MIGAVLLLLAPAAALGQSVATELYNQANALYQQGQFEAARDQYAQAAGRGAADPRLYYNLGNACFKAGRLGEAVLWYERALRLAPRDEDIRANLRYANQVKQDREPQDGNAVWDVLMGLFLLLTVNEASLLFSFSLLAASGLAAWGLLEPAGRPALWRPLLVLCCALLVACGGYLMARVYHREAVVEAVVTGAEGSARSGPDASQTTVFVVHEGTKVRVVRTEGSWMLVRLANGLGGWLPASVVEVI
ncbi:MAG: tetratricopeptide repeat protein [Candidatus Latescibacterota bacterium]